MASEVDFYKLQPDFSTVKIVTLFRQLVLAILSLMSLLYGVNVILSLNNTRSLVDQQMEVHAQDTATSVALSLSQLGVEDDPAILETFFNALADSGFYQHIYFSDMSDSIVIERTFSVNVEGVPNWFVAMVELPVHSGSAEVSSGWSRLGKVTVVSHPGQAYRELWAVTTHQLWWFTAFAIVLCGAGIVALRWLLAPLGRIELQANAICDQQFLIQEDVPRARELATVVIAMNRMTGRLRQLFSHQAELISDLRAASALDAITNLSNRADFDTRLNSFVSSETGSHSGLLIIMSLDNLAEVNALAGRVEGNNILSAIGGVLLQHVKSHRNAIAARRQGAEFTFFAPDLETEEAEELAVSILRQVETPPWVHQHSRALVFRMGFTYTEKVSNGPELLSEADMALRHVSEHSARNWARFSDFEAVDLPTVTRPAVGWGGLVEQVLADRSIELLYQPTVKLADKVSVGCEVYTRIKNGDANMVSAGVFLPMVERHGFADAYDQIVLELLAEEKNDRFPIYSVNLSGASVASPTFIGWLREFLQADPDLAGRLVFEIPEHAITVNEKAVREFQSVAEYCGSGVALDHFGLESSGFSYLGSLPVAYLKVHRSFTKNIHLNKDNQFYIKSLAQLAHTREILLIVEGIESNSEWEVLPTLNIDAAQGYFIGHPEPLSAYWEKG